MSHLDSTSRKRRKVSGQDEQEQVEKKDTDEQVQDDDENADQNYTYNLIDDVLDIIFSMLDKTDLKACRLVCRQWSRLTSNHLRQIVGPIKMLRDRKGTKHKRLVKTMKSRDKSSLLPFSKFHIDLSYDIDESIESFGEFFDIIREEPSVKKLKILYSYRPDKIIHARQAWLYRRGSMGFPQLDYISFMIRFYDEFTPNFVNMPEILVKSGGIKKLNVALSSYISKPVQKPIVTNIMNVLTSPSNKFSMLSTFSFDYTFIGDEILRTLTKWKQPLQSIALGNFDLKPDPTKGAPLNTLYDVLSSRSTTLKYLRLKFDMEFPWEDLVLPEADDEEFYNPLPLVTNYARIFPEFPRMESLLALDIMSPTQAEVGWAWRMTKTSFPHNFPRLKRFHMINWEYLKGENLDFLPALDKPSMTVEEVRLPDPKHRTDPNVLTKMLSLFPKIKSLELNYSLDALEIVFSSLSNLEKLTIHTGDELINLDSVLTGDRTLRTAAMYQGTDALNYDLASRRTRPSLLQLPKFKELVLTTEDYHVRISDVAAYHVLLKMKDFSRLTVYAYPWEDTTTWMFSADLHQRMKQTITFTLHISLSARRQKFFL